jgi:hypothetical protein
MAKKQLEQIMNDIYKGYYLKSNSMRIQPEFLGRKELFLEDSDTRIEKAINEKAHKNATAYYIVDKEQKNPVMPEIAARYDNRLVKVIVAYAKFSAVPEKYSAVQ